MKKRKLYIVPLFILIVSVILTACGSQEIKADDFPSKPIKLVVPYAPGGLTDTVARVVAEVLPEYLGNGISVGVENIEGGSGVVGTAEVVNASPDGHTIGFVPIGPLAIQPHYGNIEYTYTDITPIAKLIPGPHAIVVRADSPWEDIDEWIDHVRQNPDNVTMSIAGLGGMEHIALEAFMEQTGIELELVPFDGASPAITALLGGHVDSGIIVSTDVLSYVESGDLKVLANASATKIEEFSDYPSFKEMGIDADGDSPFFLIGPKGLPTEIRDILDEAVKEALDDPSVEGVLQKLNIPSSYAGANEAQKIIEESFINNEKVLKNIGMIE